MTCVVTQCRLRLIRHPLRKRVRCPTDKWARHRVTNWNISRIKGYFYVSYKLHFFLRPQKQEGVPTHTAGNLYTKVVFPYVTFAFCIVGFLGGRASGDGCCYSTKPVSSQGPCYAAGTPSKASVFQVHSEVVRQGTRHEAQFKNTSAMHTIARQCSRCYQMNSELQKKYSPTGLTSKVCNTGTGFC
jgi:hypothetical protein